LVYLSITASKFLCIVRVNAFFCNTSKLIHNRDNTVYKGRFTLRVTFPFRHCSIFVPSEWSVFTPPVVFRQLPAQHVEGGLRLSP